MSIFTPGLTRSRQLFISFIILTLFVVNFSADAQLTPADFARFKANKEEFMQRRAEAIAQLRGVEKDKPFDPTKRIQAIQQMEMQKAQQAAKRANQPLAAEAVWTEIGPNPIPNGQVATGPQLAVSGRTIAIAVHPTNPDIVYVGTAQGGLYRTTNGGTTWVPLMDNAMSLAIGAIAIAPSSPETVYVGTGEPNFSLDSYFGVGVYRIDNASSGSPTITGPLNDDAVNADVFTGRAISRILVHPTNPATIFVSTTSGVGGISGSGGPSLPSRGIYRSTDATSADPTFTKLTGLAGNANASVRDMVLDPLNPNLLVCGLVALSGGIFTSTDALAANPTFTQTLTLTGTGTSDLTTEFAIHHTSGPNPTIYAASGDGGGRVFRSIDGGNSWTQQVDNNFCTPQCFYDICIAVAPNDDTRVYLGGAPALVFGISTNSGVSFTTNAVSASGLHVDSHAIGVSESNPTIVYFGSDGGIYKSTNSGSTWTSLNNTTFRATQFMGLAVHPTDANYTIGGTQDNGTNMYRPDATWFRVDFGDGGYAVIDQNAVNTTNVDMYHTYFNAPTLLGYGTVSTTAGAVEGGWAFRGCNGVSGNGIPCGGAVLFYAPLEQGPGNPNTIYYGANILYRSADKGLNHTAVSQNLVNPISAIGISPQNDNVRIVGVSDGGIFGTTTGSSTLTNLDAANAVPNSFVARAVVDPQNVNTAYVTLSAFGVNNIWKTTNLNAANPTWTSVSTGIPQIPVNAFIVDPLNSNILYAGTDIGVYASLNGGTSWNPLGTGLPAVAVFDMARTPNNKIRIATHGRGMWEHPIVNATPTVTIDQAVGQVDPTSASPINFTAVFSEAVNGFTNTDISFAGSTAPGTLAATITGAGPTYNVAVSGMTGSGNVVVSIPAGVTTSVAANEPNAASTSTDNTVTYNTATPPTVTLDQAVGQVDPTNISPIQFTAVFSEAVNGFTASDISFASSTAPGTLSAVITGTGPTYNIFVSGMTGSGLVVASIPAGVVTSVSSGTPNTASTSADNTVQYNMPVLPPAPCAENFDAVAAPALPTNWTTAITGSGVNWITGTSFASSAPNGAYATGLPATVSSSSLLSPSYDIPAGGGQLRFMMSHNLERGSTGTKFDGMVLEISINGGAFQNITTAGGTFLIGGYDAGLISTCCSNPIAGLQGWSGNSGGFVLVVVDLPAAANGQPVQFRWRVGTDSSVASNHAAIDNVEVVCAVPANDNCANAIAVTCGSTVTGSTNLATLDGPGVDCGGGSVAPDVWYTIVGTGGTITASLCGGGTTYDSQLDVYTGACGSLTNIGGCSDDFCGLQSQMTWSSTVGITYRIRVHGFSGATGNFSLAITCGPIPPANDNCANAIAVTCGSTVTGSTSAATLDGPAADCNGGSVAPDVWYTIVGTGGPITASLCGGGTTYDSQLDVYTGTCGSLTNIGGCSDDFCGLQSEMTWNTTAGTVYRIRVHGFAGATGNFSLAITCACTPATITCPGNITVSNAANQCNATVTYTVTTGGSPAPTLTYSFSGATTGSGSGSGSGSVFNVGVTNVTVTATNPCGPVSCSFTVTVNDNQPPTITCPANVTVSTAPGQCSAVVNYTLPTATDNCPGVTVVSVPASGSTFPRGVTIVTATAQDASGNTASCTFTVTVNDNQPPTITCPANVVVNNTPGQCGAIVNYTLPTATDNCPGVTVVSVPASGSFFPVGTTTVTATATDASGNTASCTFTVRVNDTEPPIITCPANISVPNAAGLCAAVVNYSLPTVSDNCPTPVQIPASFSNHGSGGVFTLGGNTAPGGYFFSITNTSAATRVINNFGIRFGNPAFGVVTAPQTLTVWSRPGGLTAAIENSATGWTQQGPQVVNPIPPYFATGTGPLGTCNLSTAVSLAPGATASFYIHGATACPVFSGTVGIITPPASVGGFTLTGGSASANVLGAGGIFQQGVTNVIPNISIRFTEGLTLTQTAGLPSGSTFPVGVTTNTFEARDAAGNTSTCSFTVTVNDTEPPTITCPGNQTRNTDAGQCYATFTPPVPTWADNCAVTQLTWAMTGATTGSSPATGINTVPSTQFLLTGTTGVGVTTITYTARDAAGNTRTCSFTVTVNDASIPVISTQPATRFVCAGSDAVFSVTASAGAGNPLAYQWQQWNGSAWVNIAGATASTLTIPAVTFAQNTNTYRVVLTGRCSVVISVNATLYVNPLPTVSLVTSIPPALLPGQSLNISSNVSLAGGTYAWFKNGVQLTSPLAQGPVLSGLTVDDIGTYRLVYTDPNGCIGTSADVVITGLASDRLWIYPNPNSGIFQVRFYNLVNEQVTITIYDEKGARIYQRSAVTNTAYTRLDVNIAGAPAGNYVVEVVNSAGKRIGAKKFIKRHI